MHKYFARRPHNIFRELLEQYSKEGDIIFDPFGGGGVSLVEGLSIDRRIIISDINPIAAFIQFNQVSQVEKERFKEIVRKVEKLAKKEFGEYFKSECENCHNPDGHVRWFEHAYIVKCPVCFEETLLENTLKVKGKNNKPKNGFYTCQKCKNEFKAAETPRIGSKILSVRVKCDSCGTQQNKKPNTIDFEKFNHFEKNFEKLIDDFNLEIPFDVIPAAWDRQQEDCLHRKGFKRFVDLFTKRNLIVSAFLYKAVDSLRDELTYNEYQYLLFLISSLIRYTNNMSFSTSTWMDGRPVAWAKHAYWTPNQFIETNPFEYLKNRIKAFDSAISDRKKRFKAKKTHSFSFNDVIYNTADYSVIAEDSGAIQIPANSIDMVLTDPPYGSNVQYGELCEFWNIWLKNRSPFANIENSLANEAVVHRKTKDSNYSKDFEDYYKLLHKVFLNCHRVLKNEGVLVYTFNNKNIRAWYAVIKATIDSGFYIEPEGIFFQEGIEAYRDTAHLRYDGTPQGDFIYTFKKVNKKIDFNHVGDSFEDCLENTLEGLSRSKRQLSFNEFYINLFSYSVPWLIRQVSNNKDYKHIETLFSTRSIEHFLNENKRLEKNEIGWKIKKL
ncbi:hypothetical protein INQ51_17060 [Maribellus sp. CM-23]|nr:hypothetical protein [Maribellus sp. CM-23]